MNMMELRKGINKRDRNISGFTPFIWSWNLSRFRESISTSDRRLDRSGSENSCFFSCLYCYHCGNDGRRVRGKDF